jgi:beta-N-acetylhexosaminidase
VVFFKENAADLEQLVTLVRDAVKSSFHPPVITVDQEGGAVQRFDHVLSPLPSAMSLAASDDIDLIEDICSMGCEQLKAIGFNCLLAPVVDIVSNPLNPVIATRSFGSGPGRVAEIGAILCQTIKNAGLIPVAKHFPGHGSTLEDSHTNLAVNALAIKQLWQSDLLPFRQCLPYAPAIMVGHIWLKSVDHESIPASLSSRVTTDILRNYLGYNGLIVTDDLTMKAISEKWGLAEAAIMAIEAGADLLLLCANSKETAAAHKSIVKAVEAGRISQERLSQSVNRIEHLFSSKPKTIEPDDKKAMEKLKKSIELGKIRSLSSSMSSVCALRGSIPKIDSGNWVVIEPNHPRYPLTLCEYLNSVVVNGQKGRFKNLQFSKLRYNLDPTEEEANELASQCAERNCIFLTYRSLNNQGQLLLGRLLAENAREKIQVAVDAPYDLLGLPSWQTCLAVFDPSQLSMEALAQVLLSNKQLTAICPVSLEFHS